MRLTEAIELAQTYGIVCVQPSGRVERPTWDGETLDIRNLDRKRGVVTDLGWLLHEIAHHLVATDEERALPNYGLGPDPGGGTRTTIHHPLLQTVQWPMTAQPRIEVRRRMCAAIEGMALLVSVGLAYRYMKPHEVLDHFDDYSLTFEEVEVDFLADLLKGRGLKVDLDEVRAVTRAVRDRYNMPNPN